ncbi:MAG: 2Fe-2S iron-sulfur cluster-binding protein [Myxococcota bacterium]
MPRVTFRPSGATLDVDEGTSVLQAAVAAHETDVLCCGMAPPCGLCKVAVLEGEDGLTPRDAVEETERARRKLLPFERLGCLAHVTGDVEVEVER